MEIHNLPLNTESEDFELWNTAGLARIFDQAIKEYDNLGEINKKYDYYQEQQKTIEEIFEYLFDDNSIDQVKYKEKLELCLLIMNNFRGIIEWESLQIPERATITDKTNNIEYTINRADILPNEKAKCELTGGCFNCGAYEENLHLCTLGLIYG